MYKLCKTEQSAARQRELELELLKAMTQRQYEEITVIDLCQQMGIPRKSFYRYFSGKDGALHALIDHTILDFETRFAMENSMRNNSVYEGLVHFFRFWLNQKPLLDALERSGISSILMERSIVCAIQNYTAKDASYPPGDQEDRAYTAMFGVCGLMSVVVTWHHGGYVRTPEAMASLSVRLMEKPLFLSITE